LKIAMIYKDFECQFIDYRNIKIFELSPNIF
jgi:hypothetical protein